MWILLLNSTVVACCDDRYSLDVEAYYRGLIVDTDHETADYVPYRKVDIGSYVARWESVIHHKKWNEE